MRRARSLEVNHDCRAHWTFSSANCGSVPTQSPRSRLLPAKSTGPSQTACAQSRPGRGSEPTWPPGSAASPQSSRLPAHWERLALFWRLAQTHGLAIATLMRAAHRDIVERERFSARVDAGMAGARTTAAVLAGLPVLGVCLGQMIGADPLRFLLSGGVGGWLLVVGVRWPAAGCCGRIASRDGR